MPSTKQLATILDTTEEVDDTEASTADKCKQLSDKCDIVLDKIKGKKTKRNKVIEIK